MAHRLAARMLGRSPRRCGVGPRNRTSAITRILHIVVMAMLLGWLCAGEADAQTGPVFVDFDGAAGSAPDPGVWSVVTGTGWDNGVENYTPGNVYLDGEGNLVIRAVKEGNGYTSGRVQTRNKLSLGYGTVTARIKMPAGQGLWPAFWLVGADQDTIPWPECGEVDVIELVSSPTTYYTTLHGPISGSANTNDGTRQAQFSGRIADLSTGFHSYWATHLPDRITVGIDDRVLGTFTPDSLVAGSSWVYNRPMYVIINLAVGGWAGAPTGATPSPTVMIVDSVRWDPA